MKDGRYFDHRSSIEKETENALRKLGLRYLAQQRLSRFVVDIILADRSTVIEINGDWWHANPRIFDRESDLYAAQVAKRTRDERLAAYLAAKGIRLIVLWESDIKERGAEALLREALGLPGSDTMAA